MSRLFKKFKKRIAWWLIKDLIEEGLPYLRIGKNTVDLLPDSIKFPALTSDPTLEAVKLWYRSDLDEWRYSPDGTTVKKLGAEVSVDNTSICLDDQGRLTICTGGVTTDKIADGAVTTPKIADNAVTAEKIDPAAVIVDRYGGIGPSDMQVINGSYSSKSINVYNVEYSIDTPTSRRLSGKVAVYKLYDFGGEVSGGVIGVGYTFNIPDINKVIGARLVVFDIVSSYRCYGDEPGIYVNNTALVRTSGSVLRVGMAIYDIKPYLKNGTNFVLVGIRDYCSRSVWYAYIGLFTFDIVHLAW
ncbi:hypothetical protein DRJ17_06505 [Candidatus Woesearchaeota archaeon]|nr:MAG: hypothetical protein DRJ17_06505 [Candidatus Woesearchaeota archaeon]